MMKSQTSVIRSIRFCILSLLMLTSLALALNPDEILIIANGKDPASLRIARYYCKQRNVPTSNILRLPIKKSNQLRISRSDYDRHIANPLRLILKTPEYAGKIKCLVTVYGMPYAIKTSPPEKYQQKTLTALNAMLTANTPVFLETLTQINSLGYPWDNIPTAKTYKLDDAIKKVQTQTNAALKRIEKLNDKRLARTQQIQWFQTYQKLFGNIAAYNIAQQNQPLKSYLPKDLMPSLQENDEIIRKAQKSKTTSARGKS